MSVVPAECVFKVLRESNPERQPTTTCHAVPVPLHREFIERETFTPPPLLPPPTLPLFPFCLDYCCCDLNKRRPLFFDMIQNFFHLLSICRCPSDFVGNRCQYPNPCSSSPCRNDGECQAVSHGNTFDIRCRCRVGFTDRLCLTPSNHACMSSPCRNGGTCDLITLTAYRCRCPPGWSGMQMNIDFVPSFPLQLTTKPLMIINLATLFSR